MAATGAPPPDGRRGPAAGHAGTMTDDPRRAGPGGVLELPLVVLDEVLRAVPRLVGRTRSQVDLARRLAGHVPCVGGLVTRSSDAPVPDHEAPQPVDVLSVVATDDPGVVPPPPAEEPVAQDASPAPGEDDLAVPDYDSLAASQVVPRLATLSAEELDAVRRYELAHRRRQTILNRVAQLLGE